MVLISVETCCFLLHGVEFVAWVFCIYYACQSDAQPDTRVLLFCHRENPMQTTYTNTRICAPIMQIFESDKWTENQLRNLHIGQLWHDFCAARAANTKKKPKNTLSQWNLKILFSYAFFENYFFNFSKIYLRTFNANLLDARAKLHKIPKKNRWLSLYFQPSQPTHCGYF